MASIAFLVLLLVLFLVFFDTSLAFRNHMLAGGFKNVEDASPEHQEILLSVKPELEERLSKTFGSLHALKVTSQVVAGVNYLMKVKADESYVHVKIAKPLPHTGRPPFILAVDSNPSLNADSPLVPIE
jgi:hypothetical protein